MEFFKNKIDSAVKLFIPCKKFKKFEKSNIPYSLRSKIKRKQRLWNKYLCSRDINIYNDYKRLRNNIRNHTRNHTKLFEKDILSNLKTNPKKFWKYVKKKTKHKRNIQELYKTLNKTEVTNDKLGIAQILNNYFSTVFENVEISSKPSFDTQSHINILNEIIINEDVVFKKLQELKVHISPGVDVMHPRVLKELANSITLTLTLIFKNSFETSTLPQDWKNANVTPIFKKGDRKEPSNYRPISLTSIVCKVFESIIRDNIITHLLDNNLLNEKQFGFLPNRSATLQMLLVMDSWSEALDEGHCIDVCYFDFMKAFDKVNHTLLINKLIKFNLGDKIINWIKSFLHDRKQRVHIDGHFSSWCEVTSGIPQGSVLGPLLFLLFIDDLTLTTANNSSVYLFADDTKAFKTVKYETDCIDLQADVFNIHNWSQDSFLPFNTDKVKFMRVGRSGLESYNYKLSNNGISLKKIENEIDLGINMDENLNFDKHITMKVNKANQVMGLIRRTFVSLDINSFYFFLYSTSTAVFNKHIKNRLNSCA